jgi:hypothetical protein
MSNINRDSSTENVEPTSSANANETSTVYSLSNLLEPASSEMNRNNNNNATNSNQAHASTSHSHTHLNPAVYMADQDELSTNLDQTVLNLVNPNNIMSMLGDAINQQQHHHGHQHAAPLQQLTPQQQQELLQQVLQQHQNGEQAAGVQPGADQQPAGFVNVVIKALQSSLPFIIILVAKIFHQHLLGFFIVLGFITTLHWSNRTLVNQVQLKVNTFLNLIKMEVVEKTIRL